MKCLKFTRNDSTEKLAVNCNNCADASCLLRCVILEKIDNKRVIREPIKAIDFLSSVNKELTKEDETTNTKEFNNGYAYIDGSFNQKTGVYGYGGFIDNGKTKKILKGSGNDKGVATMRNVAGELLGAMNAIKYAKANNFTSLTIYYDYAGIEAWPTGKWKTNKKYTQDYRDYVNKAIEQGMEIVFKHVKGHSNNAGNDMADILAKEAVGL